MTDTQRLKLTELVDSQAQKEVTVNETLWKIDAILGNGCKSRTTTAQPASPVEGDVYIVPTSATGTDWTGQDGKLAQFVNGAWIFYTCREGWQTWVLDEDDRVIHNGTKWTRQEVVSFGPDTDTFEQCIQIVRNGVVIGVIDNSSSHIRVKGLGSASARLINGSSNGIEVDSSNRVKFNSVVPIAPSYTVSTLPSASTFAAGMIYVSNESGGAVLAFSDGTNWRRVTDRAVVS
jgi:hypothetical protein